MKKIFALFVITMVLLQLSAPSLQNLINLGGKHGNHGNNGNHGNGNNGNGNGNGSGSGSVVVVPGCPMYNEVMCIDDFLIDLDAHISIEATDGVCLGQPSLQVSTSVSLNLLDLVELDINLNIGTRALNLILSQALPGTCLSSFLCSDNSVVVGGSSVNGWVTNLVSPLLGTVEGVLELPNEILYNSILKYDGIYAGISLNLLGLLGLDISTGGLDLTVGNCIKVDYLLNCTSSNSTNATVPMTINIYSPNGARCSANVNLVGTVGHTTAPCPCNGNPLINEVIILLADITGGCDLSNVGSLEFALASTLQSILGVTHILNRISIGHINL
jgi:hypothetical protein